MRIRFAVLLVGFPALLAAQGKGRGRGENEAKTEARPSDARVIEEWFRQHPSDLPPGLAKKNTLPPGLARQLRKNGTLPPGLQKKIVPLPVELVRVLPPLPAGRERVMVSADLVIVLDRTTAKILEVISILASP